jgi:hypothetical protein
VGLELAERIAANLAQVLDVDNQAPAQAGAA